MEGYFHDLAALVEGGLRGGESSACWLSAEQSEFVRFNRGKVRQAGSVQQALARLSLIVGDRHAAADLTLSGDVSADAPAVAAALDDLRALVADLPPDPHLLYAQEPRRSRSRREASLPPAERMVDDVVAAAAGRDLVGFLASGPVFRGFASSSGQRDWHEVQSVSFDYSLHLGGDRAVKDSYAGFAWSAGEVRERVDAAAERLSLLGRPARSLSPGRYRAYLAPSALAEVLGTLAWGGFSAKALRTRQSVLGRLYAGEASLSPAVRLVELTAEGLAPAFQPEGFARPPSVPLVHEGRAAEALISPRTAREYGLATNGAGPGEAPESLDLAPGSLPSADALRALGTGLWIGNLWYLNFSDRLAGRLTGMTRFATFWVEGGHIVAPASVMRFDDSIYDLLGSRLEALTAERDFLPDSSTYGERQTASMRAPGALIDGITLTL